MSKKRTTRPLSSRVQQELEDTESYMHKLSPEDRKWLMENYVQPELMQQFPEEYPQDQKRKVWRKSKLELRCVDGCPGWLEYDSDRLEPTHSERAHSRLEASEFLASTDK